MKTQNLSIRAKALYELLSNHAQNEEKSFFLSESAIDYKLADFGASTSMEVLQRNKLIVFNMEYQIDIHKREYCCYRGFVV